jgi:hypothetical protein
MVDDVGVELAEWGCCSQTGLEHASGDGCPPATQWQHGLSAAHGVRDDVGAAVFYAALTLVIEPAAG